jgi:hypothetical protein
MAAEFLLVDVTGNDGRVLEPDWLGRAEGVHRQLRTGLPADYAGRLRSVFANGGRMTVAVETAEVRGVALWRVIENTYEVANPEIDIVIELIGGYGIAKELVLEAIANGKHVVTANKALLAVHGTEIFAAAQPRASWWPSRRRWPAASRSSRRCAKA